MALLTQDYIENKEMFTRIGNAYWKTGIAEKVSPREFEGKGLVPRADFIETFLEQKYKVNGDLSLLMRMNQFFGK